MTGTDATAGPTVGPAPNGAEGRRWNVQPRSAQVSTGDVRRNPRVRMLKLALVAISAALLSALLLWPQFADRRNGTPLEFSDIDVGAPTSTMTRARYVSGGDRAINVAADKVVQDAHEPAIVNMDNIAGDTTTADGAWLSLQAVRGSFNRETQRLTLDGDVALFTDSGNELHAENAIFDLPMGWVRGGHPVRGHGPYGRIAAEHFEILEKGAVLRFGGGVFLVIEMGSQDG